MSVHGSASPEGRLSRLGEVFMAQPVYQSSDGILNRAFVKCHAQDPVSVKMTIKGVGYTWAPEIRAIPVLRVWHPGLNIAKGS